MIFDTTFLLIVSLFVYIFTFLYLALKKKLSLKQCLILFGILSCYTFLINNWNFPLKFGSPNGLKSTWSLVPFYNLHRAFTELPDIAYMILRFSFTSIVIIFVLGMLIAIMKVTRQRKYIFIFGVFIIELVGSVQVLNGLTTFKAFDTSIIIVQFLVYVAAYYLTRSIVNNLIKEGEK